MRCSRCGLAAWFMDQAQAAVICVICQHRNAETSWWHAACGVSRCSTLPMLHCSILPVLRCSILPMLRCSVLLCWCSLAVPLWSRQGCGNQHLYDRVPIRQAAACYTTTAQRGRLKSFAAWTHNTKGLQETACLVVVLLCPLLVHALLWCLYAKLGTPRLTSGLAPAQVLCCDLHRTKYCAWLLSCVTKWSTW